MQKKNDGFCRWVVFNLQSSFKNNARARPALMQIKETKIVFKIKIEL